MIHLDLWNIKDLTDSGLRDALQESPQLQWLELINCANITGVIQLSKSATMYTFDCFKGHTFIICQCPSITVFSCDPENLQSLSLINQPAVDRAMFRSTLAKIHQLRKLEITGYIHLINLTITVSIPIPPATFTTAHHKSIHML